MNSSIQKQNEIFENLFVLELANNHWGSLERGLKIIRDHATVIRYNKLKAAIKLQVRDVDEFVHQDFKGNQSIRYIKKTKETKRSRNDFANETFERDFYLAIPLQKGQLSCREVMNGERLTNDLGAASPLTIHDIDGPYAENPALRKLIERRGA